VGTHTNELPDGIDMLSGEVAEVITAPGPASGGDVIEFDDALWVSAYERGLVFKLNRPQD
jgi:hypothetical protein